MARDKEIDFKTQPSNLLGITLDVRKFNDTADKTAEGEPVQKIQAFPYGRWMHPMFGEVIIDKEFAYEMKANFDANVRGQDIPTDYEHGMDAAKGNRASGWVKAMEIADDGINWLVEFTKTALQEIKDKEWRYFSPTYADEWTSPITEATHRNVAMGGGLTNMPFLKGIMPINFSEFTLSDSAATVTGEAREEEHAEPGTGQPPQPRETERTNDQPPYWNKDEPNPNVTRTEGDMVMTDEQFKEFLAKLGLAPETKPEEAVATLSEWKKDSDEFKALDDKVDEERKFAEMFPERAKREKEQATRLAELEAERFVKKFTEIGVDKKVLPMVAAEGLKELHKKFSEGKATVADVESTLEGLLKNGTIELGEKGAAAGSGSEETTDAAIVKQFTDKMNELQSKDKLTTRQAIRAAANEMPDAYRAYRESVRRQPVLTGAAE